MLGDVFNEKKRIYSAFFAVRRASAPSGSQFKRFFDVIALYYKSLFIKSNTHLSKPIHSTSEIHRTIKILRESYYLSHDVFMKRSWENRAILVRQILRLSRDSSYE